MERLVSLKTQLAHAQQPVQKDCACASGGHFCTAQESTLPPLMRRMQIDQHIATMQAYIGAIDQAQADYWGMGSGSF